MSYKKLLSTAFIVYMFVSCKQQTNDSVASLITEGTAFNFYPSSTNNDVVERPQFTFSYMEEFEQAEWVAYFLDSDDLNSKVNYDRPYFNQDKKVKTGSAHWRNFKKSGYNKGHLCPAADRKANLEDYETTFLTSNASPQLYSFNAGIWNRLEQKVRYWANRYNGVYIVTGGVLTDGLKTIGTEDVAVPNMFYKIILTKDGKNMLGFLLPHQASSSALYNYVVPVDSIEKLTGIDFFPSLEDSLEEKLEKRDGYSNWKF